MAFSVKAFQAKLDEVKKLNIVQFNGPLATFLAANVPELLRELADIKRRYGEIGNTVLNLAEKFQDEGDRVYLESTNDAELLKQEGSEYWDWAIQQEDFNGRT